MNLQKFLLFSATHLPDDRTCKEVYTAKWSSPKNITDSMGLLIFLLNMFEFKAIHQASAAPDLEIVST
ncbi:MAG: hypothetical protein ACJ71K_20155 [Nitrososphaeraceae archaeon]